MRPDDGRAIPTFIGQALRAQPLTVAGDGSQTRSICYVDDLVDGILRLLHSGLPGPMNIGNACELSILALAELIVKLVGSASPIRFVPLPQDDPAVRRPDVRAARRDLGWQARIGVEDGLRRTIEWFAGHPAFASASGF